MLLRLQRYDFIIEYGPGKQMLIADALSRAYGATLLEKHQAVDTLCEVAGVSSSQEFEAVHATADVELPEAQIERLEKETENDSTPCRLKKTIQDGWPERSHNKSILTSEMNL